MNPQPAAKTLDAFFLEARSRLLDLAAILDRIGRGKDAGDLGDDRRLEKIRQALEVLQDQSGGRAERIQQIFSDAYDPSWNKPTPMNLGQRDKGVSLLSCCAPWVAGVLAGVTSIEQVGGQTPPHVPEYSYSNPLLFSRSNDVLGVTTTMMYDRGTHKSQKPTDEYKTSKE